MPAAGLEACPGIAGGPSAADAVLIEASPSANGKTHADSLVISNVPLADSRENIYRTKRAIKRVSNGRRAEAARAVVSLMEMPDAECSSYRSP